MAKFNVVVEYDFYEEYDQESFEQLVAAKIAESVTKDIAFGSAGAYRVHIEKVSKEAKNGVVKQMVNLISEDVLTNFDSKLERKLNTELNKKFEEKMYERISNRVKKEMMDEVKKVAKNEIRNTFKSFD